MIDWVDAMLKSYGLARARLDGIHDKPTRTRDNLIPSGSARSFMGRLLEGDHVGHGKRGLRRPDPPEGLVGDAKVCSLAIQSAVLAGDMGESDVEMIYLHYVIRPKLKRRFQYFDCSSHVYYGALHRLHVRLAEWIKIRV